MGYDVALIKLRKPLDLNARISKIHLPQSNSNPNGSVIVVGWGATSSNWFDPMPADILQAVNYKPIDDRSCESLTNEKYQGWIESISDLMTEKEREEMSQNKLSLHKTSFCAMGPRNIDMGTCNVSFFKPIYKLSI